MRTLTWTLILLAAPCLVVMLAWCCLCRDVENEKVTGDRWNPY